RPNPLGGLAVAGPIQDPGLYGTNDAYFPMPIVHGMTVGELARLDNDLFGVGAELEVLTMEGWSRTFDWSRTKRPWGTMASSLSSAASAPFAPVLGMLKVRVIAAGHVTCVEG